MKKQDAQDERVVAQRRKIQSDAFGILYVVLLLSAMAQDFLLDAPFEQYAVELICFFGMSVYLLIRNIAIGNNIFGEEKRAKTMPLVNSLVTGTTATVVFGVLNYTRHAEHYENNFGFFLAGIAIFFISVTLSSLAVISLFVYLNQKKQAKIQRRLDEEEQDD